MYEDKRLPEFEEMKEIAWQISSKSAGHTAGFILLSDLAKSQAQESEEPPAGVPAATTEEE
jgi:hypothetical protein